MSRTDLSPYLIHFTKGENWEGAFQNLLKIMDEQTLPGGTGFIKGSKPCVCFSEAPLGTLNNGLVNPDYYSRYSPFGILIEKEWLFKQGGRPVIYQTEKEYDLLSTDQQWRHVTYNPLKEQPVDFTWEREWRICCQALEFNQTCASIVVPDESWLDRLEATQHNDWHLRFYQYCMIFDEMLAREYADEPEWRVTALK